MSNINNNANKKHSYDRKTSSRVTPKIREYLAEIANEREVDLERFMILSSSSPASSGVSVGAQSFNKEATATTTTTRMRSSSSCCRSRSRSRASSLGVGVQAAVAVTGKKNREDEEVKITNIPIVMEKEQLKKANSVEDLRTPTKGTQTDMEMGMEKKTETRKTQTPESALKSHKRLEWDPAADVGYQLSCERAVSTSNISTLERSVLEAATTLQRPNQSETDLNRLKGTTKGATKTAPPLASSTLVNRSASNQTQMAPLPSSNSRSLSRRESCATSAASSFDYHHNNNSRPSTAGNSNSTTSTRHSLSAEELLRHMEQQRQEREYSAQLEQVLSRRRCHVENKENQQPKKQNKSKNTGNNNSGGSSSSSSCALAKNDLDLGIDLLCSLVNKRSLSQSQKKQLAKDIIKRLVGFEMISSSRSSTRNSTRNSSNIRNSSQHKEQSQQTEQNQARGQDIATNTSRRSSLILPRSRSPPTEPLHHLVVPVPAPRTRLAATPTESSPGPATCSYASTSSGASNDLVTQKTNPPADKRKSTDAAEQLAMQEYLNPMTQSEIEYEQKRQQRDNLSMERRTQIDWIDAEIRRLSALQNLLRRSGRGDSVADETQHQWKEQGHEEVGEEEVQREMGQRLPPAGGGHPAPPAPPVTPVFMAGGGGAAIRAGEGVEGRIADGRTSSGASSGAGAPSAASAEPATGASSEASTGATGVPLGAGTATAAASGASSGAGGATGTATEAGAATGTERPSSVVVATSPGTASGAGGALTGATAAPPPPAPALPSLTTAAAAVVAPAVRLRSKMATPTLSHSGSSESVCSFVQQRQRQFLAHYQNQQQQRLEQQQQLFMLQQQQQLIHRQQQQQQQQHHLHAACHMSQQRQQHCHHHEHHQQQQQQHYVQMQYAQAVGNSYSCPDDGAVYYHVLSSQGVKDVATATVAAAAATATMATATDATAAAGVMGNSTTSSSSLLCLSSEMSIPMGGMLSACEATTTTTTTTTTHQYDDVACQQLQLQQQQQQQRRRRQQQRRQHQVEQQPMEIKQQMLQMRPRGIAYMLQFTGSSDNLGRVLHESLTVQDYLQRARPQFCAQSKQRKAILNQMQLLRNARRRELDELILIEGNSLETIDRQLQRLPPPVTSKVRIFSTKEMKALTNKRCENLPEVLAAQNREREERRRRSNRIMRDVFNRRLQRRVRSGKLSLNHSRTVI